MIPVTLRLSNFMSYGAQAPVLDFEAFHVACLSGNNGQGKSALLDAITWALWGRARKTTGRQNPSPDLLRTSEREMSVEFEFDAEGERYRVVRTYAESPKGSKTHLELHGRSASDDTYRPLSCATIAETGERITRVLGIDYDTFINSAFLLQGRSDEFTKKAPGKRKEVLSNILNLGRYEELRALAQDHVREAVRAIAWREADINRLGAAEKKIPGWKAEQTRLQADVSLKEAERRRAREEEQALAGRVQRLESQRQEVRHLLETCRSEAARLAEYEADTSRFSGQIAAADAVISSGRDIRRDFERHRELEAERETLTTKSELVRTFEQERNALQRELVDRRHALERHIDTLRHAERSHEAELETVAARLAEEPDVRAALESAQEAAEGERLLRKTKLELEQLDTRIALEEQAVLAERQVLERECEVLGRRRSHEDGERLDRTALLARRKELERAQSTYATLDRSLESLREQGQAVSTRYDALAGEISARRRDLAEKEEQVAFMGSARQGQCPTCGTGLTQAHREKVERELRGGMKELADILEKSNVQRMKLGAERAQLREAYASGRKKMEALEGVAADLAAVNEQLRQAGRACQLLREVARQIAEIRQRIADNDFAHASRQKKQELVARRKALQFDPDAYEQMRSEAVRAPMLLDQMRAIEVHQKRRRPLQEALEQTRERLRLSRRRMEDGTTFGELEKQIRVLSGNMEAVGLDEARLAAVRSELRALDAAPRRMLELSKAVEEHAQWEERRATVRQRAEASRENLRRTKQRVADLKALMAADSGTEARLATVRTHGADLEAALAGLHAASGQITEKLTQAAEEGRQREQYQKEKLALQEQRALYRHLTTAFGKHGIPSLIIEETLPDIEERTNEILGRLSGGKMHVRIETQKAKQKGGTAETLEIKIIDELGQYRTYETYSGGEAFRVNFALRIALSQLLAERSGVRVRMLVIDEGFGTQDTQGVDNLIQAIHAIKDDFSKILVISHIPDVKNAFPVRIEVEKLPSAGSRFDVIGT